MNRANEKLIYRFSITAETAYSKLLWFRDLLILVLTGGVYFFWCRNRRRANLWNRIQLNDQKIEYLGSAKEDFNLFLKLVRIYGTPLLLLLYAKDLYPELKETIFVFLFFVGLLALISHHYFSTRIYLSNLYWQGKNFSFNSNFMEYLSSAIKWNFLTLLTLGVLAPLRSFKLYQLQVKELYFDSKSFEFSGNLSEFAKLYWKTLFLSFITLGVFWSWHRAITQNYLWNHTKVGSFQFKNIIRGDELFWLNLESVLLMSLTLGLAWPWVRESRIQLFVNRMAILSDPIEKAKSPSVTNSRELKTPLIKTSGPSERRPTPKPTEVFQAP